MFSAVPSASSHVFIFCAPRLIFGGPGGDGSRFHVLRPGTSFRRYRGHHVPFSCFALPDTFSAEWMASGPVFMFYALGIVFMFCSRGQVSDGAEGVGSRFHVLRSLSRFPRYRVCRVPFSCFALLASFSAVPRVSGPVFKFCAPELIFGGTKGVRSCFHVLRSRTCFRLC
jgi:hypothetical protein